MSDQQKPGEPVGLRPEVLAFARLMEVKLRQNDHRPGWKNESLEWLFGRLMDETEELRTSILRDSMRPITPEAVDVANFAMMIADNEGDLDSVAPQPEREELES